MGASGQEQVVVATEHVRMVLAELGAGLATPAAENVRLGLTLVTLADPHASLVHLGGQQAPDREVIDGILSSLRLLFESRYAGWVPTMGKNRTLTGIQFKPYSNGGGFERPEPAPSSTLDTALGSEVKVGLLDTRIVEHPAFDKRYTLAADALAAPVDSAHPRFWWEGHATFIAGLILRAAPSAHLDVRTALQMMPGVDPAVEWTMPLWDFAERLGEYQESGVQVLNLSLGVSTADGKPPLVLERAIGRLTENMVVVAAAGNHGTDRLAAEVREREKVPARNAAMFPAALDGVVAVGAKDGDAAAEFNPKGADGQVVAPWIDVFESGVDVASTYLGAAAPEKVLVPGDRHGPPELEGFAGWATWSGTSFAAGTVTGRVAALIASGRSPAEAEATIREQALADRLRYSGN